MLKSLILLTVSAYTSAFYPAQAQTVNGGGSPPSVTSFTIAGTASQISATGTCIITTTGTCTLSMPDGPTIPGHPTIEGVTSAGATGTGVLVFGTNPTLASPILGAASATTLNKVAITAPATSATLTIADGSTLATAGANSITFTSTGPTNVTLPTSGKLQSALTGTTGSIGGSALTAGACASGSVTVTGATTGMQATASPALGVDPTNGGVLGISIIASVSAADTVTVKVCTPIIGTPASATYAVRVFP